MMRHDSRNGWQVVRLGDVTSIESGSGFPTEYQGATSGQYPFYKVSDMNLPGNEIFMRFHNNAIKEQVRAELKAKAHPIGTVIFPKIGAAIATNKKRILTQESCFDNNVIGIYPSPKLDSVFLYHMLLIKDLSDFANTGNPPSIRKTTLEDWQIPLPPLTEQKRIAGILDAADALRAKRRSALAELDTLLQSTFLDMFGDPVTNPMGWERVTLGDVANFHAGSTLPPGEDFQNQNDGFLYLKVSDLNHPDNSTEIVRANLWGGSRQKGIVAPKNAVVIPKRGGAIGTNKKRVLTRPAVLDPNLMAISAGDRVTHFFIFRWFHTFDLMSLTSGSSVPQLNKKDLAPLSIPLPPLALQNRFADVVQSIEQQKLRMRSHLAELDTLFASLQSRAFNGEL